LITVGIVAGEGGHSRAIFANRHDLMCPWPITDEPLNHLNVKQFSSSIATNTNRNTNTLTRDIGWQK
jgi:hypothetical protein